MVISLFQNCVDSLPITLVWRTFHSASSQGTLLCGANNHVDAFLITTILIYSSLGSIVFYSPYTHNLHVLLPLTFITHASFSNLLFCVALWLCTVLILVLKKIRYVRQMEILWEEGYEYCFRCIHKWRQTFSKFRFVW